MQFAFEIQPFPALPNPSLFHWLIPRNGNYKGLSVDSCGPLPHDDYLQDMGEVHHLGEHIHDVAMQPGPADKLLQGQLPFREKDTVNSHLRFVVM